MSQGRRKRLIEVNLRRLRPNNWYLNREKLDRVRNVWRQGKQADLPPVLITTIDGELCLIDGHSRAYAAFENGCAVISAEHESLREIGGCTAHYVYVHREAVRIGLRTVADLTGRILEPEEHRRLWIEPNTEWIQRYENRRSQ